MQRLAHHDPDVFNRVVLIDIDIAFGLDRQVEEAMFRQQFQHVIKKPDGRVDLPLPAAV